MLKGPTSERYIDIDISIFILYLYMLLFRNIHKKNGTNGKRQLSFVCCKRKMEMANFLLFSANGERKFVFSWSVIDNGNQRLLNQQTYPSMYC